MVQIAAINGSKPTLTNGNTNQLQLVNSKDEQQSNGKHASGDLEGPNHELVEEVRRMLRQEYEANSAEELEQLYSQPHYDDIMDPKSAYTCWRYLLHCDKKPDEAVRLIKATLIWRKENKIDTLQASDMIKDFWLRAPIGFTGRARDGTEIVYAIGKNFRKPSALIKQTIRDYIAYILFNWDRKHRDDLDQLLLVFDVSDTGLRNIDLDFSSWLVSIRDFIPARIKAIYFVGIPFLIRPVIRLILSWLPERFRRIAHCGTWQDLVEANIDPTSLPEEVGGKANNSWRLAPLESHWAHETEAGQNDQKSDEIFDKICEACSFNVSKEQLEELYKMQTEYELKQAKNVK